MGSTLVKGLVDRGFEVRVWTIADIRIGDITKPETLTGCFDGVDTVYHLAAVLIVYDPSFFQKINVGGTRSIIDASIKAGDEAFYPRLLRVRDVCAHDALLSLSLETGDRAHDQKQAAMDWTIVRPTLAYNENGGEEFNMFLAYLKKYPFVPFIGAGRSLKRPVHCDDLMKGFLAMAGNSKSYGKTYAFSRGEAIAIRDMAKLMLKHVGQKKLFITIPIPICRIVAFFAEKFQKKSILTWNAIAGVTQDADLNNSEARNDLGYNPVSFREGLQRAYPI
jgi:nucleoside-diphosphate-sugar epimerase